VCDSERARARERERERERARERERKRELQHAEGGAERGRYSCIRFMVSKNKS